MKEARDNFLQALWSGGGYAYFWRVKPDGSKETLWFPAERLPAVPEAWAGSNVYFGVNTTARPGDAHSRALKEPEPNKPNAPIVAALGALYCEWDAKDFDGSKEAILAHIDALWRQGEGLPWPSVLVDSGGGWQGYWLLEEPLRIDDANRAQVAHTQAEWVRLWEGDDNVKDLARVLRLPGTRNFKYSPPRPVTFHPESKLERVYSWEQLTGWIPEPAPAPERTTAPLKVTTAGGERAKRYGAAAANGELTRVANAQPGNRNFTVNQAAYRLGRLVGGGVLDDKGLVDALTQAGVQAGLPEKEARKEATNGLTAGQKNPRVLPALQPQANGNGNGHSAPPAEPPAGDSGSLPSLAPAHRNGSTPKPEIQVNNRQLSEVAGDALQAIELRNGAHPRAPVLCTRGGQLVRVLREEAAIQSVGKDPLKAILAHCATWVVKTPKPQKTGAPVLEVRETFPPKDVIDVVSGWGEWPTLPKLEGIVSTPVLAAGGQWVTEAGFDACSGLYLVAGDPQLADTTPTAARVEWAKRLILEELLGDFPFVDDASRAHAVGLLLLGFVRHAIDGATPLHLVDAPTPGTGKGLLTSVCCLPAAGAELASMSAGRDDEEWRKRLTAKLAEGATHINLDNLSGTLDSASLSVALTQSVWGDRVLGSNATVRVKVRTIWSATANNLKLSDEIRRRCVWIRLDANAERPEERTGFRHADLVGWAHAHRAELATAAVVLVRHWQEQGAPAGGGTKGSFQAWARTIGGILAAAGIPGFLANERELYETAATDAQAMRAFVAAWAERHGSNKVTVAELMPLASTPDAPAAEAGHPAGPEGLLDAQLGAGPPRARAIKLGHILGAHMDRVFSIEHADGGPALLKISRGGKAKGVQQWQLAAALV